MANGPIWTELSKAENTPRSWSRSTVADGTWMQSKTLWPMYSNELYLADQLDKTNTNLETSANRLVELIGDERERAMLAESNASAYAERLVQAEEQRAKLEEANASAYAKSYADEIYQTAHNEIDAVDKRVDGVSSTFNSFTGDYNVWKTNVTNWQSNVETWSAGINRWRNEDVDPALIALQEQIDALEDSTDVIAVYGTYAQFQAGSASIKRLTNNDCVKVLSGTNGEQDYYQCTKVNNTWTWNKIGSLAPYYSKSEIEDKLLLKANQSELANYYTITNANATFQTKNDMSSYYKKTQTSGKDQLAAEFGKYAKTNDVLPKSWSADYAEQTYVKNADITQWFESDYQNYPIKNFVAYDLHNGQDVSRISFTCVNDNGTHYWYFRKKDDIKLNGKTLEVASSLPLNPSPNTVYIV